MQKNISHHQPPFFEGPAGDRLRHQENSNFQKELTILKYIKYCNYAIIIL